MTLGTSFKYTCPVENHGLMVHSCMVTCKKDGFGPAVPEGGPLCLGQVGSRLRPFDSSVRWVRVNVTVVGYAFT